VTGLLSPDYYLRSVRDIDLEALRSAGIDTLLFDLDNTVLPRNSDSVPQDAKEWAQDLLSRGFKVCIVSNNWHERVHAVAAELGVEIVAKALKPLPFALSKALKVTGSTRGQSVIVGDQVFTDVLGGKLLGIKTVLVVPLSSSDLPHTVLLRKIERVLLAGRQPLP
jgi:HAD superfamily phosphatase (TIGR01668 family)